MNQINVPLLARRFETTVMLLFISLAFIVTSATAHMPPGFDYTDSKPGTVYYGNLLKQFTFREAQLKCRDIGATIIKIRDAYDENRFERLKKNIWIDARDLNFWNDNTRMTFKNFFQGAKMDGMCAAINALNRKWNTYFCDAKLHVICEMPDSAAARLPTPPPMRPVTQRPVVNPGADASERFERLERRLEQISNSLVNRVDGLTNEMNSTRNSIDEIKSTLQKVHDHLSG